MPEPADRVLDVRGVNVHVLEQGNGPPILFLHGAGGGGWLPFMDRLAQDFRVIAPDHPGYGTSETPDWLDTVGDLATFYLDFLDALELDGVHLMGSSMGGWISADLASRNTNRLASLTLVSAAGLHVDGAEVGDFFIWNPEEIAHNLFHDQSFAEAQLARQLSDAEFDIVLKNRLTSARLAWAPRLHDPHLYKRLHRIDVPTLILWGDEDHIIGYGHAAAFEELIPDTRSVVFKAVGHLPFIEAEEKFVAAVEEFIGGLGA